MAHRQPAQARLGPKRRHISRRLARGVAARRVVRRRRGDAAPRVVRRGAHCRRPGNRLRWSLVLSGVLRRPFAAVMALVLAAALCSCRHSGGRMVGCVHGHHNVAGASSPCVLNGSPAYGPHRSSPSPSTSPAATPPAVTKNCPRTLQPASIGLREFKGHSDSSVTLYGLLFARYPLPAGRVSKIAWRMTGSGHMRFTATGPHGWRIAPAWKELHSGGDWHRPGEEWGTGFRFPVPGCWTVRVTRGTSTATARLLVK
jgi:hypothetical protein